MAIKYCTAIKVFTILAFLAAQHMGLAQQVQYTISSPNAAHHEAEITLQATEVPSGEAIFRMSRSSPGRYATHEFGKNIYHVKATDAQGSPLAVVRKEADVYAVPQHKGTIILSYTLYANYADGTYAAIDTEGWHLNMPATFMWLKGSEGNPIQITLQLPDTSWKIATQLLPAARTNTFTAPNFQYFMDSPLKAGKLRFRQWQVAGPAGKPQTIRIAFETNASDDKLDAFAQSIQKICAQAAAVFGTYPAFEGGQYTFLASINPYVQGDGMEHRNSTMISLPMDGASIDYATGVFSHEFFHAWNVERIRPEGLEPFNFERSNVTDGLWVGEGFTQYYGSLLEVRAGVKDAKSFLAECASAINTKLFRPGGQLYTVMQNSQHAVFSDAGSAIDRNNFSNIFSSYYITGAAMALALDATLRADFGKTLDHYMRTLWQLHGATEKPYTTTDLEKALAITTGNERFARQFFADYIMANKPFPFADKLKALRLLVTPRQAPDQAWMGQAQLEEKNGKLTITRNTIKGTPLYEAGMDLGDELLSLNEEPMASQRAIQEFLKKHQPGTKITVSYTHRNLAKTGILTLATLPDMVIEIDPKASNQALQRYKDWLAPQH